MASNLSDSSDKSSDEEDSTSAMLRNEKRKFAFSAGSAKKSSKKGKIAFNYKEYYKKEMKDKQTEEMDSTEETPSIKNFYDTNKLDLESEEKLDNSYYNKNALCDLDDKDLISQNDSLKVKRTNYETDKESNESSSVVKPSSMGKAERMMQSWGYLKGKGIGKDLQGRAEPIATSMQKGRRGLGLELKELVNAQISFKPEDEMIEINEKITWLENVYKELPTVEELKSWKKNRKIGEKKDTIDGETIFCDEIVVKNVVNSKSIFDRLDKREMDEARMRSNPFETISGSIFLNRAAVKMANIDKACNFMFTNPSNLQQDELLYFADVCAGPGGFSEYVLWKKNWYAKGFGFTLRGENDFKLNDFHAAPCESFHPYYGPDETGNVYKPENQTALRDLIMRHTENQGVHFMMSDGGFSVEGQENIQEILSKQLYLCQCLIALMIVRTGGHFVTKLFDLFTPFSAGLVYIMYRCFNSISIFKPNTSRPANSERFLICKEKRADVNSIVEYLFETNIKLTKNNKKNDILELVPVQKLISEKLFFDYLKDSNEQLGQRQVIGLKKIAAYAENKNLLELKQESIREDCLKAWKLPLERRVIQRRVHPAVKAKALLGNSITVLEKNSFNDIMKLTKENISNTVLSNEYNWYGVLCSSGNSNSNIHTESKVPTFFLGMGRTQIYKYSEKGHWERLKLPNSEIELPRDTLVYGEIVTELKKEDRSQTKTYGLHILDAFSLGTIQIAQESLTERIKRIDLFCKSLWKPSYINFAPVRVKDLLEISEFEKKLVLQTKSMKNSLKVPAYFPTKHSYEIDNDDKYYYIPTCLIFFRGFMEPWNRHLSRKLNKMYFYDRFKNKSVWEMPDEAIVNFTKTIQSRITWNWPNDDSLTLDDFLQQRKASEQK